MDLSHTNTIQEGVTSKSGAKTTLNLVALFAIISGTIFKMMHWKGADILILFSTIMLLSTIYYVYRDTQRNNNDGTSNLMLAGLMFMLIVSGLFKRFHWEGANILLIVAAALTLITVLYLIFRKGEMRLPKQFAITFVLYVMYIMGAVSFLSSKTQVILDQALQNQ